MAKKRNNIEQRYNRFSAMSVEEMDSYRASIENELQAIEERLSNKEKELEGRQATIDLTTEADTKDVLIAQKETAEQEYEDLKAMRAKKNKELRDFDNYDKNKDKIDKIIKYKNSLDEKLMDTEDKFEDTIIGLEKDEKQKAKIDGKLKKSEELDNNTYNELMKQKEAIEKEISKKEKALAELQHKIRNLRGSVNKCDMVWKNLMQGRSWDEIHIKAVRMNLIGDYKLSPEERVTEELVAEEPKGIDEDDFEEFDIDEPKPRKESQPRKEETKAETSEFISEYDKVKGNVSQEESMSEYDEFAKRHPGLAKIRDLFKRGVDKIKEIVENRKNGKDISIPRRDGMDLPEIDGGSDRENSDESVVLRDKFVEELRQQVDEEYKRQVREAKEQEYIEMHEAKADTKDDKDGEER